MPDVFSIPAFAASVLEFLNNKKLTQVSIFGYSMGGYVALYLAAHYPEHIKKIFTLATKLEWTEVIAQRETAQLNAEKILEKVPAFAAALNEIHSPQNWKTVLEKTSEMLSALGKAPALTEKEFRQIKIPVTIAVGELDKMVSVDESKNAVHHLQNGKLLQLPSTPHPFEKANHQMLAEHLKRFFA
jgi:esterase/lipase